MINTTTGGQPLNPAAEAYTPLHQHPPLLPWRHLPPPPTFLLPPAPPMLTRRPVHILWAFPYPATAAFFSNGKASPAPPPIPAEVIKESFAEPPPPPKRRPNRRPLPPRRRPTEKRSIWQKKNHALEYPLGASTTTVMIRNIPNRISRRELFSLLADHCAEVNSCGTETAAFDLLYVPVDFARRGNKGYAFVNFTTVAGAAGLYYAWNRLRWDKFRYSSGKIREITAAKLQGESLRLHLEGSRFDCDTDDYLPVVLTPACNGFNLSDVSATTVGSRIG